MHWFSKPSAHNPQPRNPQPINSCFHTLTYTPSAHHTQPRTLSPETLSSGTYTPSQTLSPETLSPEPSAQKPSEHTHPQPTHPQPRNVRPSLYIRRKDGNGWGKGREEKAREGWDHRNKHPVMLQSHCKLYIATIYVQSHLNMQVQHPFSKPAAPIKGMIRQGKYGRRRAMV
jgi:hypothetical protein